MQDTFDEIVSSGYTSIKTDEEFNLGLALAALLQSTEEPEFWTDEMINGVMAKAEVAVAIWKLKYSDEILDLNEQD